MYNWKCFCRTGLYAVKLSSLFFFFFPFLLENSSPSVAYLRHNELMVPFLGLEVLVNDRVLPQHVLVLALIASVINYVLS